MVVDQQGRIPIGEDPGRLVGKTLKGRRTSRSSETGAVTLSDCPCHCTSDKTETFLWQLNSDSVTLVGRAVLLVSYSTPAAFGFPWIDGKACTGAKAMTMTIWRIAQMCERASHGRCKGCHVA